MVVQQIMTNLFKYDFAPTRAPPIGIPNLNLPGSFNSLSYAAFDIANQAMSLPWLDLIIIGFAAAGVYAYGPKMLKMGKTFWNKAVPVLKIK
jgi:hypothetical protein